MEWSEILALKAWTPLRSVAEKVEVPGDCFLLKVGPHAYLFTRTVNKDLERNDPNAPFITKAYWATSEDAVRRCLGGGDPTIGGEVPSNSPPPELLLGSSGSYGELVGKARALRDGFSESGSYSNQGKFLYKLISSGRFEYCFLDNEENDDEQTFLIQISLVKT